MFDKFIGKDKKNDFASTYIDGEKRRIRAGEPLGSQVVESWPDEAARCHGLQSEATAGAPLLIESKIELCRKCSTPRDYALKAALEWAERWGCSLAVLGLLFGPPGVLLCASRRGNQPETLTARELVKDVTRKEQFARKNPENYYKYVQVEKSADGTKTSIRIETPSGEIGEVVSVDGKPPSAQQCRKGANALKKLTADPKLQQRQAREQKEQSDRIDTLMAAVPDAFIFNYQAKQPDARWIVIKFRPNPAFQPPSHEAALLKGMRGTLWVDPASHRLAKIDGTLSKDVNFGWGFLASLHQGGHFAMQQSLVPGGSWKQTFLQVDLDGSKLLLGQLHVHFKDVSQSFVKLADSGTLADAVSMLEHSPLACNERQDTGTTAQANIH